MPKDLITEELADSTNSLQNRVKILENKNKRLEETTIPLLSANVETMLFLHNLSQDKSFFGRSVRKKIKTYLTGLKKTLSEIVKKS